MLNKYFHTLFDTNATGDAREESYYPTLKTLIEDFSAAQGKKELRITVLPKKTDAGNPDFRIWDGKQHITGYIEAKKPESKDLNRIEKTPQLKRYRETFPNLILTNFYEFRLYRNGKLTKSIVVADPILHNIKSKPSVDENKKKALFDLFEEFLSYSFPRVLKADELAAELAKRTRFLRYEVIAQELEEENIAPNKQSITGFYLAFKKFLLSGLTKEEFADIYSQTITYGLFAARSRSQGAFNRRLAHDNIPKSIGILRDIFKYISLGKITPQLEWIIDDISEVLSVTDVGKILSEYYEQGKGSDPIIHFYETFLAKYAPKTRKERGVYYTPEPVVSYIVNSVNNSLRIHFDCPLGFADSSVTVLDPAAGTLTFLAEAIRTAVYEFENKHGKGATANFIKEHILNNFHAFELMMAPYAVAHMKIAFLLNELGCALGEDDRFKLYLTNALETDDLAKAEFPGIQSLSEENHEAAIIKKDKQILAIVGNPPYSGQSANASYKTVDIGEKGKQKKFKTWIGDLIDNYKYIDGASIGEKNSKWLQDDYVKFIRFAQWKIDTAKHGIIGFITNHSYLDNPTFMGMRWSLMQSFDEIYILDLHGNALKREKSPDGKPDYNVFQIKQGVAIAIFIRKKTETRTKCKIHYASILGSREDKFSFLENNDITTTKWKELKPEKPDCLFIPVTRKHWSSYKHFPNINDIFPMNNVGIATARDNLTIHRTQQDAWNTAHTFAKMDPEIARAFYNLGDDVEDWKVKSAQEDLLSTGISKERIVPILYRPFDVRFTYYTGNSRGFHCRPRNDLMKHLIKGNNLAIITSRMTKGEPFKHAFITDKATEVICLSPLTSNNGYVFPLYYYNGSEKQVLLFQEDGITHELFPNLNSDIVETIDTTHGKKRSPESILYYVYGVLYSNEYRKKYEEFLKRDFPGIPFTKNPKTFEKIAVLGEKLVNHHLLRIDSAYRLPVRYQGKGKNNVEKIEFDPKSKRLLINNNKYFENLETEVWEYRIGGYQVCERWLKYRIGTSLSLDEIMHFCKMTSSIKETLSIQNKLDLLFVEAEKAIIKFHI